jgi:histidyl-tRNA synthetase
LGGPPTPGVGWAAGVERILAAADADGEGRELRGEHPRPPVFVAADDGASARTAFALARELRASGRTVQLEQAGRSLKGQFRHADRLGAEAVVVVGRDGFRVRDMGRGTETEAEGLADAIDLLEPGR